MRSLAPPLRRYVTVVIAAGVLLLIVLRPVFEDVRVTGVAFFVGLALLAEALTVPFPRGNATISVGFVVVYASILYFGPAFGAWIAALGTLRPRDLSGKVELYKVAFNRALLALSAGLTGLVYERAGGVFLNRGTEISFLPLFLCGLTYIAVNTGLMVGVMSLQSGSSPRSMFLANFKWAIPNLIVFQPLGLVLARLYALNGASSVALLVLPLFVARHSFRLYIKMRQAYLDTILTLTAALDAKDPSTLGHSERVAHYAYELGRALNLEEETCELLMYSGVLHDIGKIGVRDAVLKKPGRFTVNEYEEMKAHSALGAEILGRIRLLERGVSWVKHHHERYDGEGFPHGLKADDIPLGARIIAVADSLDAITSSRPYKRAMSWDEALEEMQRCSGGQFDPMIVDALIGIRDTIRPSKPERQGTL